MAHLVAAEFLDSLNYKLVKFDGCCGMAKEKKNGGKKHLTFNLEGISCDYNGVKLPENIAIGIGDDWGTRTTFSGYICTAEHLKTILELTR